MSDEVGRRRHEPVINFQEDTPNMAIPLREQLAAARAAGLDFKSAWPAALESIDWADVPTIERDAWGLAFRSCRSDWAAAYRREMTDRLAAVSRIAV